MSGNDSTEQVCTSDWQVMNRRENSSTLARRHFADFSASQADEQSSRSAIGTGFPEWPSENEICCFCFVFCCFRRRCCARRISIWAAARRARRRIQKRSSGEAMGWGASIEVGRNARAAEDELKRGNPTAAAAAAERAVKAAPQNARLWFLLGYASRLGGAIRKVGGGIRAGTEARAQQPGWTQRPGADLSAHGSPRRCQALADAGGERRTQTRE